MATKIEWAEEVWNPITGCTPVSEGCRNCYAKRMATRLRGRFGYPEDDPFRVTLHPDKLELPLRWEKPRRIFVCSMGDLFHEDVPEEWLDRIFATIRECLSHKWDGETWHPVIEHTFLILTKRPERMKKFVMKWLRQEKHHADYFKDLPFIPMRSSPAAKLADIDAGGFMPHVWLGVTAENQETADKRIPILLQIPAAVRFVSVEPMLGPVDLNLGPKPPCSHTGCYNHVTHVCEGCGRKQGKLPIDWIICGGESGPGARPVHPDWVRSLRDQCVNANIPFFFKQWGEYLPFSIDYPGITGNGVKIDGKIFKDMIKSDNDKNVYVKVGKKKSGRLLDGKEWNEYPDV